MVLAYFALTIRWMKGSSWEARVVDQMNSTLYPWKTHKLVLQQDCGTRLWELQYLISFSKNLGVLSSLFMANFSGPTSFLEGSALIVGSLCDWVTCLRTARQLHQLLHSNYLIALVLFQLHFLLRLHNTANQNTFLREDWDPRPSKCIFCLPVFCHHCRAYTHKDKLHGNPYFCLPEFLDLEHICGKCNCRNSHR